MLPSDKGRWHEQRGARFPCTSLNCIKLSKIYSNRVIELNETLRHWYEAIIPSDSRALYDPLAVRYACFQTSW